jgi:hypothetical protein
MLNKIFNLKKEIENKKKIISKKRDNIETKKKEIKGEMDKWGKTQTKKNFP